MNNSVENLVRKLNAWETPKYYATKIFRSSIKTSDKEVLVWLKDNAQDYLPPYLVDSFIKNVNKRLNK